MFFLRKKKIYVWTQPMTVYKERRKMCYFFWFLKLQHSTFIYMFRIHLLNFSLFISTRLCTQHTSTIHRPNELFPFFLKIERHIILSESRAAIWMFFPFNCSAVQIDICKSHCSTLAAGGTVPRTYTTHI